MSSADADAPTFPTPLVSASRQALTRTTHLQPHPLIINLSSHSCAIRPFFQPLTRGAPGLCPRAHGPRPILGVTQLQQGQRQEQPRTACHHHQPHGGAGGGDRVDGVQAHVPQQVSRDCWGLGGLDQRR